MNNQPIDIEAITGVPLRKPVHDLGTTISFNEDAEMYSVSSYKENKKKNLNKNTFQQSSVNVGGKPPVLSTSKPSALDVKKSKEYRETKDDGNQELRYGRRLNWQNDKIVEMHLQLGHVKEGDRYSRVKAYISIKTEDDSRYMIFMRSSLTTALDETFRSIRKDNDKVLEAEAGDLYSAHHKHELYLGRVKYKPTKGSKICDYHRKNLPLSLLSIWIEDDEIHAQFYLLDTPYDFILNEPVSKKQQPFYSAQGTWTDDTSALSINEAFGG